MNLPDLSPVETLNDDDDDDDNNDDQDCAKPFYSGQP